MSVYRFSNGTECADLEISDQDARQIRGAMGMRGFSMVEENPGPPTMRRLTADEVGALFHSSASGEVRGPDGPVGVVGGDIRIRGGVAVPI